MNSIAGNGKDGRKSGQRSSFALAGQSFASQQSIPPTTEQPELSELEQVWARRAADLAREQHEQTEDKHIELALVRLGQEIYGIGVENLFDIRPEREITPVPRTPAWIIGVVNVRGQVISVVDLQAFLGLSATVVNSRNGTGEGHLVVAEIPSMEVVLRVDEVLAIQSVPASAIQDAGGTVRGIHAEYVKGVVSHGSGDASPVWVVLDLVKILNDPQLIVQEEIL
ncbi:MAG: purine-binding chemotaxis protein CheW [Chloroflexota bacterium]|nr:MAG: purine-binding chemotaxis protein CheW [Chloroflexota bacterium]